MLDMVWLAERAVGLVDGVVRTVTNEVEYNRKMAMPAGSRTIGWIIYHASSLMNLDTNGSDGKGAICTMVSPRADAFSEMVQSGSRGGPNES